MQQEIAKQNILKGTSTVKVRTGDKQKVDIEKELSKIRQRSRSRSLSPKSRALQRAKNRNKFSNKQHRVDLADLSEHSEPEVVVVKEKIVFQTDEIKLQETKQQYNNLKADLMRFKTDKMGSNLDDHNLDI